MAAALVTLLLVFTHSLPLWAAGETPPSRSSVVTPGATSEETTPGDSANPLKPLTAAEQSAYKKLIDISACAYTTPPGMFRIRVTPSILRIPQVCGGKSSYSYQCYATVYCINPVSGGFYLERALCLSQDGNRCPSAKTCALSSIFDSSKYTRNYGLPVLHQKESETAK